MRHRPHVPAILKLPQILRKMLPADMDMCAVDPALKLRPKALQGVDHATGFGGVLGRDCGSHQVAIAGLVDVLVPAHFVRADRRAGQDIGDDQARMASLWRRVTT